MNRCLFANCNELAQPSNRYCSKLHAVWSRDLASWVSPSLVNRIKRAILDEDEKPERIYEKKIEPNKEGRLCRQYACRELAAEGQIYCSREHAPFGHLGGE